MILVSLRRPLVACALAVSLAGCVAGADEITTNVASNVASMGGLLSSAAQGEPHVFPVFVASTRQSEEGSGANVVGDGKARYSQAMMSVPPGHEPGVLEQPSFGAPSPQRHIMLARRRAMDEAEFFNAIATNLSGRVGSNRDVLVFVHGFNNDLAYARMRLTQLVTDAGFGGVPVLFSWPSRLSMFAYGSDRESATAARDALEKLLADLSRVEGVGRVHVLAHSMGTWVAMEALRQNAIAGRPDLDGRLGEVMLAAPDLDLGVFAQQRARLRPDARISVFAARNDRALSLSQRIAGDRARLGNVDVNDPAIKAELAKLGVKVYDLTDEGSGLLRHDTFAQAASVVSSIGKRLAAPRVEDGKVQSIIGQRPDLPPPGVTSAPLPPPVPADAATPL